MGKRKPLRRSDEDGLDKPAYARGEETEKAQGANQDEPRRSTVQLEEALKGDIAAKLMALKQTLEPAPEAPRKSERPSPAKRRTADTTAEEEPSFEELLNPRDDDESFEALLEQSKLDWRFFKGDD
ncbi:DUF3886 domain-containing protein [Alicyclobacillus fructus]|uniref:DUF3886 domain-containing protein n=1 Tax=Alicyclobacillus fructus TaxID=2816082 RepID=UPI001A8F53BC|nr:DUF3886 domain-containing protein [Alicyclobacillus fructus]